MASAVLKHISFGWLQVTKQSRLFHICHILCVISSTVLEIHTLSPNFIAGKYPFASKRFEICLVKPNPLLMAPRQHYIIQYDTSLMSTSRHVCQPLNPSNMCFPGNERMIYVGRDTSRDHLVQPEAGLIPASSSGTCPAEFWASPRMETTQPRWATCADIWPPSHENIFPSTSSESPVFQLVSTAFHSITAHLQEV